MPDVGGAEVAAGCGRLVGFGGGEAGEVGLVVGGPVPPDGGVAFAGEAEGAVGGFIHWGFLIANW